MMLNVWAHDIVPRVMHVWEVRVHGRQDAASRAEASARLCTRFH
jgi:hypothetical protein